MKISLSTVVGDVIVDVPVIEKTIVDVTGVLAAHPFGKDLAEDEGTVAAMLIALEPLTKALQGQLPSAAVPPTA